MQTRIVTLSDIQADPGHRLSAEMWCDREPGETAEHQDARHDVAGAQREVDSAEHLLDRAQRRLAAAQRQLRRTERL